MFQGHAGLSMEGDHLDISYNRPEEWPKLTPSGSIRAFIFNVGDAIVGPCFQLGLIRPVAGERSEEHTSELQSLMRISYAVFCLKKKINTTTHRQTHVRRVSSNVHSEMQ